MFKCSHFEVRRTHPGLDRSEGMLGGLPACRHFVWVIFKALLYALKDVFAFPPRDAALFARRTVVLDRTCLAGRRPVTMQNLAAFLARHAIGEMLTRRAAVDVLLSVIDERTAIKPTFCLGI